ncbi:MAG: hypothetical protein K6G55_02525 [Selenomonadaceae bacterium]|nr:hypothetical protein [Selenomonadaceae bacterium]
MDDNNRRHNLQKNLRKMIRTTKQNDIERALRYMIQTTHSTDLKNAFNKMIGVTRSLDKEVDECERQQEKNVADAFRNMIQLTHSLERDSENEIIREEAADKKLIAQEENKVVATDETKLEKIKKKLPRRIRNFPAAFRRNPKVVIKYFLGMILGRMLAIVLYVLMAFIPALPVPDAVANMSKPPAIFGTAFNAMRGFVTDFNSQMIITTVTNIPADINKLLQKIGEFFQYYARRFAAFIVRAVRHPKLAINDLHTLIHEKAPLLMRLLRGGIGVFFSLLLIKLMMIFLLPLFGGIAITILGIKVSIILVVVVRMILDKIGELIAKILFSVAIHLIDLARHINNTRAVIILKYYVTEFLRKSMNP